MQLIQKQGPPKKSILELMKLMSPTRRPVSLSLNFEYP